MNGEIQTLARTLGIDSRVTFHGFQPTDRAGRVLRARAPARRLVASRGGRRRRARSGGGRASPTVGTAVGYVADWHPDRAVAVPVRDPDALATAIGDLLARSARGARGWQSAAREWTLAHDADWTAASSSGSTARWRGSAALTGSRGARSARGVGGVARRSGHQMTASPIAMLIAAPAPPSAGISSAPATSLHHQRDRAPAHDRALRRRTRRETPCGPELLSSGIRPTLIHNSAGAAARERRAVDEPQHRRREQRAGRSRPPPTPPISTRSKV